jgi:hypothetical protein
MKVALCTGSSSTDLVLMNKLTVDKCLAGDYCDYRCISIIVSCVVADCSVHAGELNWLHICYHVQLGDLCNLESQLCA